PLISIIAILFAYLAIDKVGENDPRYAIENLAETVQITAYDIRYGWGARYGEGSGYTLGELDGTFYSMLKLMPDAINVSLFRPYLWEVSNPFMLLAALESLAVLILTIIVLIRTRVVGVFKPMPIPIVIFCLVFSIVFAFAVGVSTFNFGTLMRYKIPLMPYFLSALILLYYNSNRERKFDLLEETE
ncbi:MAG: hypothetical protein RLO00_01755, partial [Fulvivirga sp.]